MRERAGDGIKRYTAVTSGEHLADQNFSALLQCSGSTVAPMTVTVIASFFSVYSQDVWQQSSRAFGNIYLSQLPNSVREQRAVRVDNYRLESQ